MTLEQKIKDCLFVAHSLFERGKVAGSAANLSFLHDDICYITRSGGCFGTLSREDFSALSKDGQLLQGRKPSKEYPLHRLMYGKGDDVQAVLHTHSPYATLWSCLPGLNEADAVPEHTPYLKMQLGTVGLVPYAPPGSDELFGCFARTPAAARGFLLAHHGPVVGAEDILSAFFRLEELEESCRAAWMLRGIPGSELPKR